MACEICKRSSCTRSFHSIEEQERYDEQQDMSDDVDELRSELQETQGAKTALEKENDILRSALETRLSPCGHSEQYCYTKDDGAHIVCLLCVNQKLRTALEKIAEGREVRTGAPRMNGTFEQTTWAMNSNRMKEIACEAIKEIK